MTEPIGFSNADRYLHAALTGLASRQRVVASNVANVDTPNFKASEVRFEDALKGALARQRRGATPASAADLQAATRKVTPIEGTTVRADGNNVDIDREMVMLAETTVAFNALTQVAATRFAVLRNVVTGR